MSKYQVTITATVATITALLEHHVEVMAESMVIGGISPVSDTAHTRSYTYTTEAASSSEVIDRVFAELEQVGVKPAGVRVSVRPVEAVKP